METILLVIIIFLIVIAFVLIMLGLAILSLLTKSTMQENGAISMLDEFLLTVMRYSTYKGVDKTEELISKGLKKIYHKMRNIDVTIETPNNEKGSN